MHAEAEHSVTNMYAFNSLTTKKQTTKFSSANYQKMKNLNLSFIILSSQRVEYSVDLDEVALYEPPYQDLRYLQIQLFSSLIVEELTRSNGNGHRMVRRSS